MTEVIIDSAEQEFLTGNLQAAAKLAHLAKVLDPFFGSVDRYVAAYDINVAAMKMTASGERDWYQVLGLRNSSATLKDIIEAYNCLAKLVHPDFHCSAAAKRAFRIITQAVETLADSQTRLAYDLRSGLEKQRAPREPRRSIPIRRPN